MMIMVIFQGSMRAVGGKGILGVQIGEELAIRGVGWLLGARFGDAINNVAD